MFLSSLRARSSAFLPLALSSVCFSACISACFSSNGPSGPPSKDAGPDVACNPGSPDAGDAGRDSGGGCNTGTFGSSSSSGSSSSGGSSGSSSGSSSGMPLPILDASEDVVDAEYNGNVCAGVNKLPGWTGTLTLDYSDSAMTTGAITVAHSFQASFALVPETATLPGAITVNYVGQPTGTGTFNETLMTTSATETNVGSGALHSIGNMVLTIDGDTCTFKFKWEWGVAATFSIDGTVASMPDPENAGALESKDVPLGDWQRGLSYSAGFPVHGQLGGSSLMPDYYELVTQLGYYLFLNDMTAARGPASVSFSASPDTNPGDP